MMSILSKLVEYTCRHHSSWILPEIFLFSYILETSELFANDINASTSIWEHIAV